ncbi:hypothetical protein GPECTOR_34g713 [Gonium pectorale]|uniref:UBA domain-containing protein n=1 Tax=Gonium pectorale TaxID=33097 RepID=A0A150GCI5_GONPE|nr:hypothetical protein GPECTOR_34g713 [Gonium pectorale]|eukprot:KXZ47554.1 hypothetical protein GPECTOR_34g713 [Gonium pectorale]
MQRNPDGSLVNPAAAIQALKSDRNTMDHFRSHAPKLYDAIMNDNVAALQEELRRAHKLQNDNDAELERLYQMQEEDPFNPELQAKIEDAIRRKNIDENYEAAMEHNPENFIQVHMLYVDMEVNGVHVKAFIDSGAQMTIMTAAFAEKCHLTRLMDERFKGMAVGVGSSRILGKIHQAKMKVGDQVVTTAITVLEQKTGPQFIFGLDMLRRHQCCVDLAKNVLRIGSCGVELPFLAESQIPKDFSEHVEDVSEAEANRRMESDAAAAKDKMDTDAPAAASGQPAQAPAPAAQPAAAPRPAAQPAPQVPPSTAGSVAADNEAKIAQLMALGADRNTAVQALHAAGGNVDMAASFMFDM